MPMPFINYFISQAENFCFRFISLIFELSKQTDAKYIHVGVKKSGSAKNLLTSGNKII